MFDPAAIRSAASSCPPAELPQLIGALAEATAIANRRLHEPTGSAETLPAEPQPLLDASAMSARLNIKKSWLLDMARQGRVPHVRLGRYVRFRESVVLRWAEGSEVPN